MDFVLDLVDLLFEILPPGVAAAIMTAVGAVIGFVGKAWHGHEQLQLAACNSMAGRFAQAFNGTAQVDCGAASLLSKLAVVVEIVGFLVAAGFAITFLVLTMSGKLVRKPKSAT